MSASAHRMRRSLAVVTSLVLGAGLLAAAHGGGDVPVEVIAATDAPSARPVALPVGPPPVPTTAAATTTTEPAPTTTTTAPAPDPAPVDPIASAPDVSPVGPPPDTSAPAPSVAPPPGPDPAPAPPPRPAPAPAESDGERMARGFRTAVPATWTAAILPTFEVIPGSVSWASSTDLISIAAQHLHSFDRLVDVVAHEFGHLIAFRYGSQAYPGAPPAGWPAPEVRPEEAWADCVQRVFVGRSNPTHGLGPCEGAQLASARAWLGQGPGAHPRTG